MTDKLLKISDQWLLIETATRQGLISLSHIDEIWTNYPDKNSTLLLLSANRGPIPVEVPFDDVLAIITGPPKPTNNTTNTKGK
jgi:hypothetical protein